MRLGFIDNELAVGVRSAGEEKNVFFGRCRDASRFGGP